MDAIHEYRAGLDVHKKTVNACVRRLTAGNKTRKEQREFGTMELPAKVAM